MHARLIAWYPTPYAVYTAAYAADGRLWFGGGFWYGSGYLGCVELDGTIRWYVGGDGGWSSEAPPAELATGRGPWSTGQGATVSGLCLDGDERRVALSLWSSSQHTHPALVLRLGPDGPVPLVHHGLPPAPGEHDRTPTGVLIHEGHVVVRSIDCGRETALDAFPIEDAPAAGAVPQALASRRLVGLPGAVVTGWKKGLLLRELGPAGLGASEVIGGAREVVSIEGWGDAGAHKETVVLGTRAPPRGITTAISIDLAATAITTGADDGSIARWQVVREPDGRYAISFQGEAAAHRFPVSAACRLAAGALEATADRGGWVYVWEHGQRVAAWQVERRRSPRTLAADPGGTRLAVGCKSGQGGPSAGGIAVYELAP
jgi:hypothetical protein